MRSLRSAAAVLLVVVARTAAAQQAGDSTTVFRGLELEAEGKAADAVPFFKAGLHSSASVSALLGLERVYAELGRSDSLLPVLDTLIAASPREVTFRSVQLRTLQALGR